jgi:hypothetical protein
LPILNDVELVKLREKDINGGTILLKKLRPKPSESSLGSFWVEADIDGLGTELLPIARSGVFGSFEVSGLARWYMQKDIKAGDHIKVTLSRFGLRLSLSDQETTGDAEMA